MSGLPFGVTYLTGARTARLDKIAAVEWDLPEAFPLGLLIQPFTENYLNDGAAYYQQVGIDNGCFTEIGQARFNLARYQRLIDGALERWGDHVLFATARDVAFDWEGTLRLSLPMLPLLRRMGAPAALVLQDGATPSNIPWTELDAVFVGGSTEWKESAMAASIATEARRRHKWVHMGRVNSKRRMRIAYYGGCHSADGTFLLHEGRKGLGAEGVAQILSWLRDQWGLAVNEREGVAYRFEG
jgi:hypothetical protein